MALRGQFARKLVCLLYGHDWITLENYLGTAQGLTRDPPQKWCTHCFKMKRA